mmetsp:Transcript_46145/g.151144  ORF Transcript_46145/g.151144 Transcript_46145/m.151144 type:complete len:203 (+) Transcript_46145:996-1604(+)
MSQRRVLAVNHVVELLVLRASGASWREALQRVMPERRGAVVREGGGDVAAGGEAGGAVAAGGVAGGVVGAAGGEAGGGNAGGGTSCDGRGGGGEDGGSGCEGGGGGDGDGRDGADASGSAADAATTSTEVDLLSATASEVAAYFASKCGGTDEEQIRLMAALTTQKLEALQVAAEDVSHAGRDEEARRAGFDWAVKIGSFIA